MKSGWMYDVDHPHITWRFLSTDGWTRITGRSRVALHCAICGHHERVSLRIARFGPVAEPVNGRHPVRARFVEAHTHPDKQHDLSQWAQPLRNPAAWNRHPCKPVS